MPCHPPSRVVPRLLAAGLVAIACAASAQPPAGVPQPGPVIGASQGARPATAPAGAPRLVKWDELVPADWDPMKDFQGLDFNVLSDADPRAQKLLERMREVWDRAPVNESLKGQRVRIPGYVVPLEESDAGLKEFLLVPYFGACIHTPPPPANQIIHVLSRTPVKGVRSMDPVWITGPLGTERTDSYMGAAGYRIEAQSVEPYKGGAR
ncbi:MAG: DUF3299 domain-containing protein [Rubrivivax sp.]|jgi:hypothetical protein|nr:DUF3299 domain-containing protein [Rubrivivax sp.]